MYKHLAEKATQIGYEMHEQEPDPQGDSSDRTGEKISEMILANEPKWSKEIPTKAGSYWFSYMQGNQWVQPYLIELDFYRNELCEVVCTSDGGDYEPVRDFLFEGNEWRIMSLQNPEKPTN